MKIGLITKGTRGDIQPFIALAIGLKNKGHEVSIVTFKNFKDMITGYQIGFCSLDMDMEEEAYTDDALKVLRNGNVVSFARLLIRKAQKNSKQTVGEIDKAMDGFDYVIAGGLAIPNILPIAVKKGIDFGVLNFSVPYLRTKEFPAMGFGFQNIPWINQLSYTLFACIGIKLYLQTEANKTAEVLNLPKWTSWQIINELFRKNRLTIHPMSKQLLKQPQDWPSNAFVTGFLEIPAKEKESNIKEQIPEHVQAWISKGEQPIYIGFGSIPVPDIDLMRDIIVKLLEKTQHRIIFAYGWTKPFLHIEHQGLLVLTSSINHSLLLPQCKMAIIHGGIGTVGSVLRAKIPLIIASIVADQPYNGELIEKLKVGIHIPFRRLTYSKLVKAIHQISSPVYAKNAITIGKGMALENGVNESVDLIEAYLKQKH